MKKVLLGLSIVIMANCTNNNIPDVRAIKVDLKPERFDKIVYSVDTNDVKGGFKKLYQQHPYMMEVYSHITGWGELNDTATAALDAAKQFLTYKDYTNLYATVQKKFPNTSKYDKELEQLFQYIKYYWPTYKTPKLYYFISGLNRYSAITYDTLVGVGLDMYLGKDYEFYPSVQIPKYQIDRCEPEYIVPNMARVVYQSRNAFEPENKNLLQLMIEQGRELYFMDKVLPTTPDELKIGYTKQQLDWCKQNELMIWNYFLQNNLVHETIQQKMLGYVMDGPNSQGMPLECPGNIGSYIGWQIVKKYMDKHSEISLDALCKNPIDGQKILEQSSYRPK